MARGQARIYTRTGDDGTTGLANGERVSKCDPRIEACGAVDETNSALGVVLSATEIPEPVRSCLTRVQHELFDLGAELAAAGPARVGPAAVAALENDLDRLSAMLPPLREFVLPAGPPSAAHCHLARAICRRAERRVWTLAGTAAVNVELLRYMNRLSDLLFVCARSIARQYGDHEITWRPSLDGPAE